MSRRARKSEPSQVGRIKCAPVAVSSMPISPAGGGNKLINNDNSYIILLSTFLKLLSPTLSMFGQSAALYTRICIWISIISVSAASTRSLADMQILQLPVTIGRRKQVQYLEPPVSRLSGARVDILKQTPKPTEACSVCVWSLDRAARQSPRPIIISLPISSFLSHQSGQTSRLLYICIFCSN